MQKAAGPSASVDQDNVEVLVVESIDRRGVSPKGHANVPRVLRGVCAIFVGVRRLRWLQLDLRGEATRVQSRSDLAGPSFIVLDGNHASRALGEVKRRSAGAELEYAHVSLHVPIERFASFEGDPWTSVGYCVMARLATQPWAEIRDQRSD
jgi:hypothetical protein